MFNILNFIIAVVVLFGTTSTTFAQGTNDEPRFFNSQDEEVSFEELSEEEQAYFNEQEDLYSEAGGNASCELGYRFGSVTASLYAENETIVPGMTLNFSGEIKNENAYPMLDASVYVRIFKQGNEGDVLMRQGEDVIAQEFAVEDINLPAGETLPISYAWEVPTQLASGSYRIATYVVTDKRFNFSGLSFTDDIIGSHSTFAVTGTEAPIIWSKDDTLLNGSAHSIVNPLTVLETGAPGIVTATLTNPDDKERIVTVVAHVYQWDALRSENLVNTIPIGSYNLPAGETQSVEVLLPNVDGPVTYAVLEAKDKDASSFLNVRFAHSGINWVRLNFPTLLAWPIQADQPASLFTCLHNAQYEVVPDTKVTLTLTDLDTNEVLHSGVYKGSISGVMTAVQEQFTPTYQPNRVELHTKIEAEGKVMDEAKMVYDCTVLGTECVDQPSDEDMTLINIITNPFVYGSVILLLILGGFLYYRKRASYHIVASIAFLLVFSAGLFLNGAGQVEAAQKTSTYNTPTITLGKYSVKPKSYGPSGSVNITLQYTGKASKEGSIALGDTVDFSHVEHNTSNQYQTSGSTDIAWFFDGAFHDSPYGYWVSSFTRATASNPPRSQYVLFYNGYRNATEYNSANNAGKYQRGINLTLLRPTIKLTGSGSMSCSGMTCTASGVGPGSVTMDFVQPTSQPLQMIWRIGHCNGCSDAPKSLVTFKYAVPNQKVTFNYDVTSSNAAPKAPAISGPAKRIANETGSYSFTATDPDGDKIRYAIDWNNDGTVDQNTGYVSSGTAVPVSYKWGSDGTYTFQARTQDATQNSGWTKYTVTVETPTTPTLVFSASPTTLNSGGSADLKWTATSVDGCTASNGWSGSKTASGNNSTGSLTNTTTYTITCTGTDGSTLTQSATVSVYPTVTASCSVSPTSITEGDSAVWTVSRGGGNGSYTQSWSGSDGLSGSGQKVTKTYTTTGTKTGSVKVTSNGKSVTVNCNNSVSVNTPPPPNVNLEVKVNNDSWRTTDPAPIDTNDTLTLRWNSSGATSCNGTNFSTGGATNNSGTNVSTPAPGGSTTFTLACTGAGGTDTKSLTVAAGLPNFTKPIAIHDLSKTFNPATGDYDYVSISFQTTNNGVSGTTNTARYSVQLDSRSTVPGTIPLLTKGSASPNFAHTINTVPFGTHSATIIVDNKNDVTESNEDDNAVVYNFGGIIPPPDPSLNITADRIQLRNEQTTVIRWSTEATYPTLSCNVVGPGMDVNPAPLTGSQTTEPITAKSEFIFTCTETTTNTTWTDSVTVETTGVVEEV